MQLNRVGLKQERRLMVDPDKGMLLCFDDKDRVNRQLPLTQLIQVRCGAAR
jgi:hypothetical protein